MACRALQQFDQDPRQEVHHSKTFALLRPGTPFRRGLQQLVSGRELNQCDAGFLSEVASFRMVVSVETTIEAKHSRVAHAKKAHHLGPCRVSLSNRLPLLERWLTRGHLSLGSLVQAFEQTRCLKRAACLLGIEQHPALLEVGLRGRGAPARLRPVLTQVVYGCDMESVFKPMRGQAKHHESRKRKLAEKDAKLIGKAARRAGGLTFADVEAAAMQAHVAQVVKPNTFYTCPRSLLRMRSLTAVLAAPLSVHRPMLPGEGNRGTFKVAVVQWCVSMVALAWPRLWPAGGWVDGDAHVVSNV